MKTISGKLRKRIHWLRADITHLDVDAIVNAANPSLRGGGGVDGAIHRAAGPELLRWCIEHCPQGVDYGQAVISPGFDLKARYVIHAVGPDCRRFHDEEQCAELLRAAYRNSLALAAEKQMESVAFPNISTGVYAFPKAKAAPIAVETVAEFLERHHFPRRVVFAVFDAENAQLYRELLGEETTEMKE